MSYFSRLMAFMQRRSQPASNVAAWPLAPMSQAGEPVNEQTALSVSAYWCCVRVVAESISQMPWRVMDLGTMQAAVQHPADRLLNRAPNPEQDAAVWRELQLRHVMTWGNAYNEIERDSSNRPVALWPIEPWRVEPVRQGGRLWYKVQNPTDTVYLPSEDMLHFRGLGDELMGYSVLGYMARTIGLSISQEASMASQMEHGSRPSGLLSPVDGAFIPDERANALIKKWNSQHSGARNHGRVVFLNQGLQWQQMAIPNSDQQLLESRQFSVLDICRFTRVPPHKVYDLSRATFSNINHQSIEFVTDTLGPWIVKLEQQADRKLISRANYARYGTQIDSKATLRMDPETRVKYFQGMRDLGAISPNEVRTAEGMDDLGTRGDLYVVPVNMQTLERAGKEPEQPQIVPTTEPPQQEEGVDNGRD